jgi:Ca2+-transporting ATPase
MKENKGSITGLSSQEATRLGEQYGPNRLEGKQQNQLLAILLDVVKEPMFILLAVTAALYFILGDLTDAIMMLVAILFVAGIEIYQGNKSEHALEALRKYTEAKVRVLRDGAWVEIPSEELVPGDAVNVEEGERVPADGQILEQYDLYLDESVLTGESLPVEKTTAEKADPTDKTSLVFQGTTVASGKGTLRVTTTGGQTEFSKLGQSMEAIEKTDTPLQIQISKFVWQMTIVGGIAFLCTLGLNIWQQHDFWKALIFSLAIAMSIIPAEIPVAFSTFMALGAFRMIQLGILAKQPKTVESLGSATVICLDKTGTITENKMKVAGTTDVHDRDTTLEMAWWASEPEPFDPMEKSIAEELPKDPRHGWVITKEYPLEGKPPMMTHVWKNAEGRLIVAAKGGSERIRAVCKLDKTAGKKLHDEAFEFAGRGCRVLGVATAEFKGDVFPASQDDFNWQLEGLVAFYDPPKPNVGKVFQKLYRAGIRVLMVTGDHAETAKNIARLTGLKGWETALTGDEIMKLDDAALRKAVTSVNVFARMFPDAKLRIVEALKANGETVAMSGDGVNDGPALKSAQIGVAMGKKGSEIAKSAASLVLLSDNLNGLVTAVKTGRRIYANLNKAIRYVISIHLPIILTVLLPLFFDWPYPHILLPLHIIFLELVMDPIAAVAFENEPGERNQMRKPPRDPKASLFSLKDMGISLLQGFLIAATVLGMYLYAVHLGKDEEAVRSFIFVTLVSANLFLTLATRSFEYVIWHTIRYKNKTFPFILGLSVLLLLVIVYIPPVQHLFKMAALSPIELGECVLAGFISVAWFELYKWIRFPQVR